MTGPRKALALVLGALVLALCLACGFSPGSSDRGTTDGLGRREEDLWQATVAKHLQTPLWTDRDEEDAGSDLMVPLHAAFLLERPGWRADFANHFRRFVAQGRDRVTDSENRLARLNYFYLASWFVLLAAASEVPGTIPAGLVDELYEELHGSWRAPAWFWERPPFPGGMRERLEWKLSRPQVRDSYFLAVTDEDRYMFVVAANLRAYERLTGSSHARSATVTEILTLAHRAISANVVPQADGGWLFHPGAWTDHPDYAFAGHDTKRPGMPPAKVPGIAEDTSHSHRWALWLLSLSQAYDPGTPERAYYLGLRQGLETQFVTHVLKPPTEEFPGPRTTNFMDGRNGIYRWGTRNQGQHNGYGPYELSGTFLLGWWAFLPSDRVREVYGDLAARFPLRSDVIRTYVGPNTSRARHPLVLDPEAYHNGYRELTVRLAARLDFDELWSRWG